MDLNRRLLDGELDLAPISSIEYARNAGRLRLLPRLCVSSEGAVDSIQLVAHKPLEQGAGRRHSRERDLGCPNQGAASRGGARPARRAGGREAADRRRSAQERVRGPDAAPLLGRLWLERTGPPMVFAVWACRDAVAEGLADSAGARRLGADRARRAREARRRGKRALRLSAGSWRATSRSCVTASARATGGPLTFLELRATLGSSTRSRSFASWHGPKPWCDPSSRR